MVEIKPFSPENFFADLAEEQNPPAEKRQAFDPNSFYTDLAAEQAQHEQPSAPATAPETHRPAHITLDKMIDWLKIKRKNPNLETATFKDRYKNAFPDKSLIPKWKETVRRQQAEVQAPNQTSAITQPESTPTPDVSAVEPTSVRSNAVTDSSTWRNPPPYSSEHISAEGRAETHTEADLENDPEISGFLDEVEAENLKTYEQATDDLDAGLSLVDKALAILNQGPSEQMITIQRALNLSKLDKQKKIAMTRMMERTMQQLGKDPQPLSFFAKLRQNQHQAVNKAVSDFNRRESQALERIKNINRNKLPRILKGLQIIGASSQAMLAVGYDSVRAGVHGAAEGAAAVADLGLRAVNGVDHASRWVATDLQSRQNPTGTFAERLPMETPQKNKKKQSLIQRARFPGSLIQQKQAA